MSLDLSEGGFPVLLAELICVKYVLYQGLHEYCSMLTGLHCSQTRSHCTDVCVGVAHRRKLNLDSF